MEKGIENKYYTPEIEEFHVGFEYQALWGVENADGEWLNEVFSIDQSTNDLEDTIRVRYLDREDIESLGYENITLKKSIGEHFRKNPIQIAIIEGEVIIAVGIDICFRGKIKNKSELKKTLSQINLDN